MPPKIRTKRQQQALDTKKKISDIATRLISDNGFEQVTVDQICREAGVAKGGFYHHFASKDKIIIEIYRQIDSDFLDATAQFEDSLDWRGKIKFTTWFMANSADGFGPTFCRQVYRSQVETGTGFLLSPQRPFYGTIHKSLDEASRLGLLTSRATTTELARLLISQARGVIYDWGLSGGGYSVIEYMDRSTSIFLDGMSCSTND